MFYRMRIPAVLFMILGLSVFSVVAASGQGASSSLAVPVLQVSEPLPTVTPLASELSSRPVTQAAPVSQLPRYAPSPRTGYDPPAMDLSHLKADHMPAGMSAAALPSRWDWREHGVDTRVQDQGNCGSCYSFAALANFESRLQIDGAGSFDFSENNAKECIWEADSGFQWSDGSYAGSCYGGRYEYVASLLSAKGTVFEDCDPYQDRDISCYNGCDYQKTLLDWRYINGGNIPDPAVLKAYIQQYGPVFTTLYAGKDDNFQSEFSNYDGSYTLYYPCSIDKGITHAVLIVGWDDNLTHAGGRGAWIVKNSWGSNWGDSGYFTIAYGSANIGVQSSFMYQWQDYDSAGEVLFLDDAGWNGAVGYGQGHPTAWGLVKLIPTRDEVVKRVEFWTSAPTTDVDVYLYDGFDGSRLSGLLWQKQNLSYAEAGYHSVQVDATIAAHAGNDLIAMVKFTTDGYGYPVPFDQRGPHETGRTYVSETGADGSWEDQGAAHAWDVGIRLRLTRPSPTATPTKTRTIPPFTPTHWTRLPIILKDAQRQAVPTPTQSGWPTETPQVNPSPTQSDSDWVIVFSDGFEGAFPGVWRVRDLKTGFGEYYWGKRDCQPFDGSYSAWAVGAGAQGNALVCGSEYPNQAYSSMTYGPFSLVGANAAQAVCQYWINSEGGYDGLWLGASIDGSTFYCLSDSGEWWDWQEGVLDLSAVPTLGDLRGRSRVWIGLIFTSDAATTCEAGAYVDNVAVLKCTGSDCSDAWAIAQSGMRGPARVITLK